MIGQGETSEPGPSKVYASGERAANVVAEFVDAARSAAESLLEEQKQQVAEKVSGIAEALHSAARSLDQSQNRSIAGYVDQAAEQEAAGGARHQDEMVQQLGVGVAQLAGTLLTLEMKKVVRRLPGNRYERC